MSDAVDAAAALLLRDALEHFQGWNVAVSRYHHHDHGDEVRLHVSRPVRKHSGVMVRAAEVRLRSDEPVQRNLIREAQDELDAKGITLDGRPTTTSGVGWPE